MTVAVNELVSEFALSNEDLTDWSMSVFVSLCENEHNAVLFLNTLSYMEHIGSYKIMATQHASAMDYPTLRHLNEETGHAVFFKRHAERVCEQQIDYSADALLAPASARAYFNRLEAGMVRMFGRSANYRTIYLYMSLVIEFRAVWAYSLLQKALDRNTFDISLERLLAEEQGHLYSMARRLDGDGHYNRRTIRRLWVQERSLYVRLLGSIEKLLDQPVLESAANSLLLQQA
ncbi:MAG: hypothetical protein OXI60_10925 [Acidiferrobacterales bacterium]|nr:hypothetical protein [Acidiferrobacterales bacterium]